MNYIAPNHESYKGKNNSETIEGRTDITARSIDIAYPMSHESGPIFMVREAMNHESAGIQKRVSEPVYPADILSDPAIQACSGTTRGCWLQTLLIMWRDGVHAVKYPIESFARIWGISVVDCRFVIDEMKLHKPCEITEENNFVTLMSRRLARRYNHAEKERLRQERHRAKMAGHVDVAKQKAVPSSSSSDSSSLSASISSEKNTDSSDPQAGQEHPPHKRFCFDGKLIRGYNNDDIATLATAFPACQVEAEIMHAALWLQANPAKKKKNVYRFVVNWLSRSQERGGSVASNKPIAKPPLQSLGALQIQIDQWKKEKSNLFSPGRPDSPRYKELARLIAEAQKRIEQGF